MTFCSLTEEKRIMFEKKLAYTLFAVIIIFVYFKLLLTMYDTNDKIMLFKVKTTLLQNY